MAISLSVRNLKYIFIKGILGHYPLVCVPDLWMPRASRLYLNGHRIYLPHLVSLRASFSYTRPMHMMRTKLTTAPDKEEIVWALKKRDCVDLTSGYGGGTDRLLNE